MAGDWIKMRSNLWDDPRVSRLCDLTEQSEAAIVGGLYWLWSMTDQHSEDGFLPGMSTRSVDRKTGIPGFGNALVTIGWLSENDNGVQIERFDEHNGASAKRRAQTAQRVANHKVKSTGNAEVTHQALADDENGNAPSVSSALPREEKRREEVTDTPSLRSGVVDGSGKPTADPPGELPGVESPGNAKERRLAEVTRDAVDSYNRLLAKPHGLLPAVSSINPEKRRREVARSLAVVKRICQSQYGDTTIRADFWEAYFAECQRDEFRSGRQGGGKDHPNWTPDFEYLTRPATITKVFEQAAAAAIPGGANGAAEARAH